MATWQQIGLALRDEELARREAVFSGAFSPDLPKKLPRRRRASARQLKVARAITDATGRLRDRNRDFSGLIAYLRSDQPLDREHRDLLAFFLEDATKPKQKGRRPKGMQELVDFAWIFYREWQRRNEEAGIRDRGLSKKMKYLSCVYTIEAWAFFRDPIPDPKVLLGDFNRRKNHTIGKQFPWSNSSTNGR
jgi:hypothetical protein